MKSSKNVRLVLRLALVCIFVWTIAVKIVADTGDMNLYTNQAEAFLQGRLDIEQKLHDVATYDGKYYVPFPPFPALLLTPFVAVFEKVNTTFIAFLLTILLCVVMYRVFRSIGLDSEGSQWLMLAMCLGTGYWQAVIFSNEVWCFAHVVAVACLFLAISEGIVSGRSVWAGVFLGLAFLSRQLCLYAAIFVLTALLFNEKNQGKRARTALKFAGSFGLSLAMYLVLNYVRFGNIFDTGYGYIELSGFLKERVDTHGLFSLHYVPFNFFHMFLQGPHFTFDNISLLPTGMDYFGTSLTLASPFIFLAFFARQSRPLLLAAWLSIAAALVHMLFYYNNGWIQFNTQRFTLDFLPIVILLVACALRTMADRRIAYVLMAYAIGLNVIFFVLIPLLKG